MCDELAKLAGAYAFLLVTQCELPTHPPPASSVMVMACPCVHVGQKVVDGSLYTLSTLPPTLPSRVPQYCHRLGPSPTRDPRRERASTMKYASEVMVL